MQMAALYFVINFSTCLLDCLLGDSPEFFHGDHKDWGPKQSQIEISVTNVHFLLLKKNS